MCGPGFVGRAAEPSDLAGVAAVAAEAGLAAPDAAALEAARGQFDVAVSAGDVIGFCVTRDPAGAGAAAPAGSVAAGDGGVATLVGPVVGAAGAGLGVERALLKRAVEGATARGVRALRACVPAGDPVRLTLFTGQGFVRTPTADAAGQLALTRTLS